MYGHGCVHGVNVYFDGMHHAGTMQAPCRHHAGVHTAPYRHRTGTIKAYYSAAMPLVYDIHSHLIAVGMLYQWRGCDHSLRLVCLSLTFSPSRCLCACVRVRVPVRVRVCLCVHLALGACVPDVLQTARSPLAAVKERVGECSLPLVVTAYPLFLLAPVVISSCSTVARKPIMRTPLWQQCRMHTY